MKRNLRLRVLACVSVLMLAALPVPAQTAWTQYARQLAAAALTRASRPSAISLSFQNLSSLPPAQVQQIEKDIQEQFASGARLVAKDQALAEITVTLSENPQGYLWTAQIAQGGSAQVVMVQVPRPESAPNAYAPTLSLRKSDLFSSKDQLLDLAQLDQGSELLVLDVNAVSLYRGDGGHWSLEQSQPLTLHAPFPRDRRGRLAVSGNKFSAYLPGGECTGEFGPGLTMTCRASDDPWPLGYAQSSIRAFYGARNFFTGALSGAAAASVPPFFSAAIGPSDVAVFAGTDGALRDLQGKVLPLGSGGDIAGVNSGCGPGAQVLLAGNGDQAHEDTISAADFADLSLLPAAPVELPGPVTALWTTADAGAATAVVHDLSNGRYDAYLITVVCR